MDYTRNIIDSMPEPPSLDDPKFQVKNARKLAKRLKRHLAFTRQLGWLWRHDDSHWHGDDKSLAEEVATLIVSDALPSSASHAHVTGTLSQLEARLSVPWDQWDANPHLVGLPGGRVLDLQQRQMRQGKAEDRITRTLAVDFDADAECPIFDTVFAEWLPDAADRRLTMAYAGYALTGLVKEHRFMLLHGSGRNGKGVLLNVLAHIMGGYALPIPQDALTGSNNLHPEWMVPLAFSRLAYIADLPPSGGWRSPLVKTLTGGDSISARKMYGASFTFKPRSKIMIGANFKPGVRGDDVALETRMLLVEYRNNWRNNPDVDLTNKLEAEAPGILNRLLEGARDYYANGLPALSEQNQTARDTYFADYDDFADFGDEYLEPDVDSFATNEELRAAWIDYQHKRTGADNNAVYVPIVRIKESLVRRGGVIPKTPRKVNGKAHRGIVGFRVVLPAVAS